ncbi:hypothetical protein PHSY_003172 [Pseudozyma hubeiensis SY62]|uniref:Uncharacterized protein n=1 Tax=Pseudozyma hubeiensis (strain SY62) TaxID=1305764 RepID=R9P2N7_PSEHS|nr:hypothetical protein PHSY_003172 [Pseudozyma hubeiensis SY62]GAC95596.1 hypothetical protein PHSY_003172 [Pseudozyma hubeiensis SY62]
MVPSPVPPPCTALPPTPGLSAASSPNPSTRRLSHRDNRTSSTLAAPSILSRSNRKSYKPSSVALTQEEHDELVQKILADLKPRHFSTSIRPLSRRERPVSVASSNHTAVSYKMASKAVEMQHSDSSQSDSAKSGEDAMVKMSSSGSKASTPQLSQSRTPTPTTPGSPMLRQDSKEKEGLKKHSDGVAMSPSAALESLRVLEQSFDRSACNSPLMGSPDAEDFTSTVVGSSPTKAAHDEDQKSTSPPPPPRVKRSSSYRKSVPTMDELATNTGLGIDTCTKSSPSQPASPTTKQESSSWIRSLTTLEAVRVLAFQQDVAEACESPTFSSSPSTTNVETATSADEVNALRLALKFTLARADTLADALKRTAEEKIKVETELGILRKNVLSMLGSQNMFGSIQHGGKGGQGGGGGEVVVEEDEDEFEDARSTRQMEMDSDRAAAAHIVARPATVVRPSRAKRAIKDGSAAAAAAKPSTSAAATATVKQPSGGVSIASLRKNTSTAVSSSVTQRYDPSRKASHPSNDVSTISSCSTSSLDDDFEMYPFTSPPPRRAATEVSMTDFLNASRMSKSEILDHDSRRHLEQDDLDHHSISSHWPLNRTVAGMSPSDYSKRAGGGGKFFGGITKLNKRAARRSSSILNISNPVAATGLKRSASSSGGSNGFAMQYREESIIPQVNESRSRGTRGTLSLSEALRDSLEKNSLREAGIRA